MEVTDLGVLVRHGGDGVWGPWREVEWCAYVDAATRGWPRFKLRLHISGDDQPTRYFIAEPEGTP
jgi:hypothetical protein